MLIVVMVDEPRLVPEELSIDASVIEGEVVEEHVVRDFLPGLFQEVLDSLAAVGDDDGPLRDKLVGEQPYPSPCHARHTYLQLREYFELVLVVVAGHYLVVLVYVVLIDREASVTHLGMALPLCLPTRALLIRALERFGAVLLVLPLLLHLAAGASLHPDLAFRGTHAAGQTEPS